MKDKLLGIGIKDNSFQLFTVAELIQNGVIEKPLDGNHGEIHPKGSDFVSSGVPFIMASDINNGLVDYVGCKFISDKQADSLQKGFAKNGDVLLTHKASIGRTAIVNFFDHPYVMLTPQVTFYRVKDREKLNNHYLKYYFDAEFFQKTIHIWASSGGTRAYIGITAQQKLPIILPPIDKQRKIAEILSAYDDLIETNNQRIATLEQLAQQIYKEWFVRMRFPGWEQTHFHHGVPDGWEVKKVKNAFNIQGGGTPKKDVEAYWVEGEINWFTPTDLTSSNSVFTKNSSLKCNENGYSSSSARMFPAYSVMMTSRATIGVVSINTTEACTNQGFITCIPNERLPYAYLYYWIKQNKEYLILLASGATFLEITKGTFNKIDILIPPKLLMNQFSNMVCPLFKQIEILQEEIDILKKTRNLLLPRLISGKLSIKQAESQTP